MNASPSGRAHFIRNDIPAFDGIRGLAIMLVMSAHVGLSPTDGFLLFPAGVLGVDMFLVLSGFLIVSALLKDYERFQRIRFRKFYLRRSARILPALLLLLAACWAISETRPDLVAPASVTMASWGALTFSLNLTMVARCAYCHPLSTLWSLSLEEQFYLLLPLTLALLLRFRNARLWAIVAALPICVSIATRYPGCLSAVRPGFCWEMKVAHGSASRFMGQGLGAILGCLWRFDLLDVNSYKVRRGAIITIFLMLLYFISPFPNVLPTACFGFDAVCIGTAGMIILSLAETPGPVVRMLQTRVLRFSGRISYGLYLWHGPALWIGAQMLPLPRIAGAMLSIVACYVIAIVSFYGLESPILRRVHGMIR